MHEMSLCENILELIQESAERELFSVVNAVYLEVGELVGVELDSMHFGFDVVVKGTLAENANLHIVTVPGTAECERCHDQIVIHERFSPCPRCGEFQLKILGGDELLIKNLEVS